MKKLELEGQKFGRFTVINWTRSNSHGQSYWLCECACGAKKEVLGSNLVRALTSSCGCYKSESSAQRQRTHGMYGSSEYISWANMIARCTNQNYSGYRDYGGRGINVCNKWLSSFETFFADMGKKPSPLHSIDRINVNGNYEPSNCRWATGKEQQRNRRNNRWLNIEGCVRTMAEWSEITGIPTGRIYARIRRGWPEYDAVMGK